MSLTSVGASDSPESIWNPSCTQHPLDSTRGPATPRKATAPPHAAAVHFLGREPDPPKSGSSSPSSALARMLDPPQNGSRSSAAIQLLPPIWSTAAIAERNRPPQTRKGVCSSPGVAMNGNKERPSLLRWPSSVAKKSGSCSSYFEGHFCKKNSSVVGRSSPLSLVCVVV